MGVLKWWTLLGRYSKGNQKETNIPGGTLVAPENYKSSSERHVRPFYCELAWGPKKELRQLGPCGAVHTPFHILESYG